MTFIPPKSVSELEELWVHKSDGTVKRAGLDWLKNFLNQNPGLLNELGFAPKKVVIQNPIPMEVYKPPPGAAPPLPIVKSGPPAWSTAPANPRAGDAPPSPVALACDMTKQVSKEAKPIAINYSRKNKSKRRPI